VKAWQWTARATCMRLKANLASRRWRRTDEVHEGTRRDLEREEPQLKSRTDRLWPAQLPSIRGGRRPGVIVLTHSSSPQLVV
jgi:hypothetical protein